MRWGVLALAALLAGTWPGAPAAAAGPDVGARLDVQREVLPNGLTVLVVPRHQAPVFSAVIDFRVGSVDEAAGATGLAHMFEHMAFKGTRTIGTRDAAAEGRLIARVDRLVDEREARARAGADPDALADLDGRIQDLEARADALVEPNAFTNLYLRNGAVGINAATSTEVTSYYVSLPANRLPFWAAMEYARVSDPVLRQFYTERDVVMEERRLRVEGNPVMRMREAFLGTAFLAHPYGHPVIGWPSDVVHLTRPMARAFYRSHYVPANMVIVLVGDLDPERTFDLVRRTFGRLPATPPPPRPTTVEPWPAGERRVVVRAGAEPYLIVGFLRPPGDDPDDAAFEVIHHVLAGSRAGRLYRHLVLDQGVATSISTDDGPGTRDRNLFMVAGRPRHPHTNAELEAAILKELDGLATDPVTPEEMDAAVNAIEAGILRTADENESLAHMLARYETQMRDWRYPFVLLDRMAALTPEDIAAVARRYLVPERRIVGELVREEPEAP